MGTDRQSVRFYADVVPNFDPKCVSLCSAGLTTPAEPIAGYKRIWIEVELPCDRDLWPERFAGFDLGQLRLGQRHMIVDRPEVSNGPERT